MNVKGELHANDLLKAHDAFIVDDVLDANKNGLMVKKRLVVNDILDANPEEVAINKPLKVQDSLSTTKDGVNVKKLDVKGKLTTDSLQVNQDLNVDGDIVIGKGTKKWIISVGDRGQLEFLNDKTLKNKTTDTDKGHLIMEPDGNLWLSRSKMRGHVAENMDAVKNTANEARSNMTETIKIATSAKNSANEAKVSSNQAKGLSTDAKNTANAAKTTADKVETAMNSYSLFAEDINLFAKDTTKNIQQTKSDVAKLAARLNENKNK
jgi:hypothetical protein